jgi:hypothetical protein
MGKKRVQQSSTSTNKRPRKSPKKEEEEVEEVKEEIVSFLPSERKNAKQSSGNTDDVFFVGNPIPASEAQAKWPQRYSKRE